MTAKELIKLLLEVPGDSEVEVLVGESCRGDWCQTTVPYTVDHVVERSRENVDTDPHIVISEEVKEL